MPEPFTFTTPKCLLCFNDLKSNFKEMVHYAVRSKDREMSTKIAGFFFHLNKELIIISYLIRFFPRVLFGK